MFINGLSHNLVFAPPWGCSGHLTIRASLAPRDALFLLKGPALLAPRQALFLTQGPEGHFRATPDAIFLLKGPKGPFFASHNALFLLKGPKGPSVQPATHYFYSRARRALPCKLQCTNFIQGPKGPFRVLEKAGR